MLNAALEIRMRSVENVDEGGILRDTIAHYSEEIESRFDVSGSNMIASLTA